MIKQAKKRGFVTFDQLNEVLPSDTTSPEQIEQRRRRVRENPSQERPLPCRLFPCPLPAASLPCWPFNAPRTRFAQDSVAAPAYQSLDVTYDAERAAQTSPPPNVIRRISHSVALQAVKLRLTLFLQPNHGFGESFRGSGRSRPQHFLTQTLRWNRPEDSPKPSIRASVPSTSAILAWTSRNHA